MKYAQTFDQGRAGAHCECVPPPIQFKSVKTTILTPPPPGDKEERQHRMLRALPTLTAPLIRFRQHKL